MDRATILAIMTSRAPLILVVGMHRSGTSLTASLLCGLGVNLPGPWLPISAHNRDGHFELAAVQELQDRLLLDLDRSCLSAAGALPLPADWLESSRGRRASAALEAILAPLAELQAEPWAIKDPRNSLLLPLWRRVAERLGLPLKLVLSLRDPVAVERSLLARDGEDSGMTSLRAQALWWHHHHSLCRDGQGLAQHTVLFEHWFDQRAEPQLRSLAHFCLGGPPPPERLASCLGRIQPQHRHHQRHPAPDQPPPAHPLDACFQLLSASPSLPAELAAPPRQEPPLVSPPLPDEICLKVVGATASHWVVHAWLNRCPLPPAVRFGVTETATALCLHLQSLASTRSQGGLAALRAQAIVLDPCLAQVQQLRQEGVTAYWIDPQAAASGWLESHFHADRCRQRLGLPNPQCLAEQGRGLWLGSLGEEGDRLLQPPHWSLPGFDRLPVADVDEARLLASWLNRCNRAGLQLVRLGASPLERQGDPWSALERPGGEGHPLWLAPPRLEAPLTPEEVEEELAWRRAGCPRRADPPTPEVATLWQSGPSQEGEADPLAAVCLVLQRGAGPIEAALESVRHQSLRPLELIVVDDACDDDGPLQVRSWLERHGAELGRAVLLRHRSPGGLAASRNTAFRQARARWCLVMDAGCQLEPEALRLCLAVAHSSGPATAAVHPLVERRQPPFPPGGPPALEEPALEEMAWLARSVAEGGRVDGLALVRRESWEALGGYADIPGGWEDLDLWCRFFEAGMEAVLCPQRLAIRQGSDPAAGPPSPLPSHRVQRRLVQERHPWLRLSRP